MGKEVIRNSRKSAKCHCPAKFQIDSELGLIFQNDHNSLCTELSDAEFHTKGYVMKMLQSPAKQSEFENLAVTCLADWGSSTSNVSQIIEKVVMKKSYSLSENRTIPPPPSYIKSIIHKAQKKLHSTIDPKDGVMKLIEYLQENKMKHSVLQDDTGCVTALSFYDPILAPTPHEACAVYTSDVTFGITDASSGISKWSFFSRLTAGKQSEFV